MLRQFSPPMRQFILWAVLIILSVAGVSALLANRLVAERAANTLSEVNARVALQAQGRATTLQEFIEGQLTVGEHIVGSELVRLFLTEAASGAKEEASALLQQKPYLNHALRELKAKYTLSEALILGKDGAPLAHAYTTPQDVRFTPAQVMAHGVVINTRQPRILPLRMTDAGLMLDIIKPILNMEEDEKAMAVGSLLVSIPVADKLASIFAPATLDRDGERVHLLQRAGENGMATLSSNGLRTLDISEPALINRLEQAKGMSLMSPMDDTEVFTRLVPVFNTPFFVLQEYDATKALQLVALYQRALYGMIALASVALIALMLTLVGHLLAQRNRNRVRMLGQTMDALVRAVEIRDPYLAGHHMRTARLALKLGNVLGYSVEERATLFYAAQLSGVGKIFVPQEILTKKTKLTKPERKKLEAHISHAEAVLKDIPFDLPVLDVISQMAEREDGKGYPNKLKGDVIHPLSKVLAASDAFNAMTQPRVYRKKPLTQKQALKELEKSKQYDKIVLLALKESLDT